MTTIVIVLIVATVTALFVLMAITPMVVEAADRSSASRRVVQFDPASASPPVIDERRAA